MEYKKLDILTLDGIKKIHKQWKDIDCDYVAELISAYARGRFGVDIWDAVEEERATGQAPLLPKAPSLPKAPLLPKAKAMKEKIYARKRIVNTTI